jgi:hypothetical protein
MFSDQNVFDGESSLPSICLCRVMSVSSAMAGASASQMFDPLFARFYRICQGDLGLLLADGLEFPLSGQFDLGFPVFSLCPACSRLGLHIHTCSRRLYCHRCRAILLERFYDKLLGIDGFTIDIKGMILWSTFRHPFEVFKDETRSFRIQRMTDVLRGQPWVYNPLWNTREAMEEETQCGVFWKGKRYRVGRLSVYQDFFSLIVDFLF